MSTTQERALPMRTSRGRKLTRTTGARGPRRYRYYPLIACVILVAAWQAYVSARSIQPVYLPSPALVWTSLVELVGGGELWGNTAITVARVYGGFALGAVIGIPAGLLMQSSPGFRSIGDAFIAAFYPLPKIALIPPLIIWLGSGESYKLAISAISAFFPIVVNTYLGVRTLDAGLLKAARDLGCSPFEVQRKVVLPGALPSILTGLHLGLGVSFILVIAAEMVAGNDGLGYMLLYAGQLLQTDTVFALLVVLTILGWAVTRLQQRLDRVIAPWADPR